MHVLCALPDTHNALFHFTLFSLDAIVFSPTLSIPASGYPWSYIIHEQFVSTSDQTLLLRTRRQIPFNSTPTYESATDRTHTVVPESVDVLCTPLLVIVLTKLAELTRVTYVAFAYIAKYR